ncbi:MAG: tetratricopeptide repeat protein [Phycisphaerales bacterium]|nr:tetratricopeptide repeat protein [Phycisphaerales bacterium]
MRALLDSLRSLLSLRWQIPLALCAAVTVGTALYRLRPVQTPPDVETLVTDVLALAQAGRFLDAIDGAAALLKSEPPLTRARRATLHRLIGELLHRMESQRRTPIASNLTLLLDHESEAAELGAPDSAELRLRLAWAHDWLRDRNSAAEQYRAALKLSPTPAQARDARMALIRVLRNQADAHAERDACLHELLLDEGVSPRFVTWALSRGVNDALDRGDTPAARALLERYGERLRNSPVHGYLELLNAQVLVSDGRADEALPIIAWIDEWAEQNEREESRIAELAPLTAMNRGLSGAIHLSELRPYEALSEFETALSDAGARDGVPRNAVELFVRASIARAEALAMLGRHEDALGALQTDLHLLRRDVQDPHPGAAAMRLALMRQFESRYAASDYDTAAAYMRAAVQVSPEKNVADAEGPAQADLLEGLARAHARAGEAAGNSVLMRHHHEQAGHAYENAAQRSKLKEQRFADLTWNAVQQFDRAGAYADAQRTLRQFLDGRAGDPRLPAALLQLGQSLEADGRIREANSRYEEVMERYPKLAEAKVSMLRSASCLAVLGPEELQKARGRLEELLHDDTLSPTAAVYRDGLLSLCDLLYIDQQHTAAIVRLENFLTLYPHDPAAARARFMLGDAFRRSALALRRPPDGGLPTDAALAESDARLRQAAAHFETLELELREPKEVEPDEADVYRRLALSYRGDCLLELGSPEALEEALATFRQISARYEDDPAALAAQVQVANINLRTGRVIEASRAIERARWLLRNMPEQSFSTADGQSRAEWDAYLTIVSSTALLSHTNAASAAQRPDPGASP